jgi:hypothetical protein
VNCHRNEEFPPLLLVIGGREKYRHIGSLRDVAEMLVIPWPSDDGEEYMASITACLEVIHGRIAAKDGRIALIRAAEEAGIPVITVVYETPFEENRLRPSRLTLTPYIRLRS